MGIATVVKAVLHSVAGIEARRRRTPSTLGCGTGFYDHDGLRTTHNHEFMQDPAFQSAFGRGMQSVGRDSNIFWRTHVILWASRMASRLPGDFVECGVNYGFMSSAVMKYLNWGSVGKTFYLLDTFSGLDIGSLTQSEVDAGVAIHNDKLLRIGEYTSNVEAVRRNFADWPNVTIIQGSIPETLSKVPMAPVAFLHIDMNCAMPEVAAIKHFWPQMSPGAVAILDDYAYAGYRNQKLAMDEFAADAGVSILSLPTGQGMIVKS